MTPQAPACSMRRPGPPRRHARAARKPRGVGAGCAAGRAVVSDTRQRGPALGGARRWATRGRPMVDRMRALAPHPWRPGRVGVSAAVARNGHRTPAPAAARSTEVRGAGHRTLGPGGPQAGKRSMGEKYRVFAAAAAGCIRYDGLHTDSGRTLDAPPAAGAGQATTQGGRRSCTRRDPQRVKAESRRQAQGRVASDGFGRGRGVGAGRSLAGGRCQSPQEARGCPVHAPGSRAWAVRS